MRTYDCRTLFGNARRLSTIMNSNPVYCHPNSDVLRNKMDIGDLDRSSKIERDISFIKTTEFALHLLIANTKTRTQRFSDVRDSRARPGHIKSHGRKTPAFRPLKGRGLPAQVSGHEVQGGALSREGVAMEPSGFRSRRGKASPSGRRTAPFRRGYRRIRMQGIERNDKYGEALLPLRFTEHRIGVRLLLRGHPAPCGGCYHAAATA